MGGGLLSRIVRCVAMFLAIAGAGINSSSAAVGECSPIQTAADSQIDQPTPTLASNTLVNWARDSGVSGEIDDHTPSSLVVVQTNGNDEADDSAAFRAALQATTGGGVVAIPAGTYYLSTTLELNDGQVLRGAGAGLTQLVFTRSQAYGIEIGGAYPDANQSIGLIQANYLSDEIVVEQTTAFTPGLYGLITQSDSPASQVVKIVNVEQALNSTRLQLEEPLNMSFGTGVSAAASTAVNSPASGGAFTTTSARMSTRSLAPAKIQSFDAAEYAGIEDLSLTVASDDVLVNDMVLFRSAANVWLRNVRSSKSFESHVFTRQTYHCEISGNNFDDATGHHDGKQGYGVDLANSTTGCLVEDNVLRHLRHSILLQEGANGNVVAFNYSSSPRHTNFVTGGPGDISFHGFSTANLIEGNVVERIHIGDASVVGEGNAVVRNCLTSGPLTLENSPFRQTFLGNAMYGSDAQLQSTQMPPVLPQAPDAKPYLNSGETLFDADGVTLVGEVAVTPIGFDNWYNAQRWAVGIDTDSPTSVRASYYGSGFAAILDSPISGEWQTDCAIPAVLRSVN